MRSKIYKSVNQKFIFNGKVMVKSSWKYKTRIHGNADKIFTSNFSVNQRFTANGGC